MSKTIVITGANRGIGLELAKSLSKQGHNIIATARNPENAHELKSLSNVISIVKAEMSDLTSLQNVADEIAKLAPEGIDELWNNAGQAQNIAAPPNIDPIGLQQEFTVNTVAPSTMTKYLLPLLRKKDTKKIVFLSSALGSKTFAAGFMDASLRGLNPPVQEDFFTFVAYGASKTALTMIALGWNGNLFPEGFTTIAIHPGWVQTDMTDGPGRAALTVDQSVAGLLKTVGEAKPTSNFALLNYDGQALPW